MLEVKDVSAGYGSIQILSDVSLCATKGEMTVIVGPNGSGKSTLLKTIFGLTRVYSGRIVFDGKDVTGMPPHKIARSGIAYLPQVESVFPSLSVMENLRMAGYTLDPKVVKERIEEVSTMFPIIKEFESKRSKYLSGGERQMLAMAMALLRRPRLMMLDEPTGNLSPKIALFVLSKITEIRDRYGPSMLLVEQNARKALEIGDRACLMVSGKTVFQGGVKELLEHPELGRLYLGVAAKREEKAPGRPQ